MNNKNIENMTKTNNPEDKVPIWQKANLTVKEAAAYSNIGRDKIYQLLKRPDCDFVLNVGDKKTLIKRQKFEDFISRAVTL